MSIYEQLAQQLNPESSASEQPLVGLLGIPVDHLQQAPLLGFYPDHKQRQPIGLLGQVMKEKLGNG